MIYVFKNLLFVEHGLRGVIKTRGGASEHQREQTGWVRPGPIGDGRPCLRSRHTQLAGTRWNCGPRGERLAEARTLALEPARNSSHFLPGPTQRIDFKVPHARLGFWFHH